MTTPDSEVYTYAYDNRDNLTSVTYPDSTVRTYQYTNSTFPNLLTGLVDENGNTYSTWSYDGNARATSSQLAGSVGTTSLSYTSSTSVTVTDPLSNTTSYTFTTENNSIVPTSLAGAPVQTSGGQAFTYDGNGFVASVTDWNGNVTAYTNDARGDILTRTDAYGSGLARTTTITWSGTWHLPTEIDQPLSRTTTFSYDGSGNMAGKTLTDGTHTRTWTYTYNGNGQVLTATDPDSNVTTLTYTTTGGYVATLKNALSQTTSFTSYDANGRLLSMTDPNGLTTSFTYDDRGRLLTRTIGSLEISYSYDDTGNLTEIERPDGSYLDLTYDTAHRLKKIEDALSNTTSYTLDAAGNITAANIYNSVPTLTQTQTYAYNNVNMLTQLTGALSQTTTFTYDTNSNRLSVADPLGHTTTATYDALNRVATVVDPNGGTITYGYDANDHIVTVSDPLGLTTTYTYDGIGDLTSIASPDTGTTTLTYDTAGNVLTTTDALSHTTTYSYDALNRLSGATYADSTTATLTYDQGTYGKGHLTTLADTAGTKTWTYDQYGRATQMQQTTTGSIALTVGYSYDAYGRLSTLTYPSGRVITTTYDSDGRISKLGQTATVAGNVTYNPYGPVTGWTAGNGLGYTRTIDQDGRVSKVALASTTTMSYTLDNANRVTGLSETATGFVNKTFGYDSRDHLTSLFNGTTTSSYTYDADSNRTSSALSGTTTYHYAANGNQLSSLSGATTVSYTYDADGHLTSDGTRSWSYDDRGRMASVTVGGVTTYYGINGLGQRIVKRGSGVPNGGLNEFVYDLQGHMLGEYDSSGNIIEETVYLGDLPVAVLTGTGMSAATYYIAPDVLGAPHIVTNSSGTPVWIWEHLAFGDNSPNQNPSSLGTFSYNLRFPGQYYDAESGLDYNMNRDYSSGIGRYVQSDPIGLSGGINTYGYVGGNPVTKTDPSGLVSNPLELSCVDPAQPFCWLGAAADVGSDMWAAYHALQTLNAVLNENANEQTPTAQNTPGSCPKPEDLAGKTPDEVDQLMKGKGWMPEPSNSGGGSRYPNPDKSGEQVRVQPGYPNSDDPLKRGPYARISSKGQISSPIPLSGNPALGQ